jgi:hypothetical protein
MHGANIGAKRRVCRSPKCLVKNVSRSASLEKIRIITVYSINQFAGPGNLLALSCPVRRNLPRIRLPGFLEWASVNVVNFDGSHCVLFPDEVVR